ncbi:MAG: ABC transporter substrate-binding protein [Hyphomicrobiales bacterium]|nr:ABC transporter substrate-binding protein [Hyphomicrobiales bacterium]
MKIRSSRVVPLMLIAGAAVLAAGSERAAARSQVTVGVTETIASYNPYADSITLGYGIWCEVLGCLGIYDFKRGDYVGMLAESWEVDKADHNVWTFRLKRGLKRHHDGRELSAEDVVHSVTRVNTDPQSKQKHNTAPIKEIVAVDKYTVRIVTKEPTAPLLEYLFDRLIITGKDLYDLHGARDADRRYSWGWGPYRLKELVIGQRMVLEKVEGHPDAKPQNPDTLIYTIMREPEQRVTALLNNEIQIAQFIPPHLADRISQSSSATLRPASSVELMFLAMSPKYKPWDNVKLRQAVCYAIDRDLIIKNVLKGQATRLDGPIGAGQYGYDPDNAAKGLSVPYDPAKARELVKASGYNNEPVFLETPVGRYINDKEITEAMIPMLNAVGINAKLRTPEWATLWADVQRGKTPFYYMGRGSVVDPSVALAQYFETGGSPRIGISDPQIDKTLAAERITFDPAARKQALNAAFKAIVDAAPACFMWRHHMLYGGAKNVEYQPDAGGRVFGTHMIVKQ